MTHKFILVFFAILLSLSSCGVIQSKDFDGHRVNIHIDEANAAKGRPNPIASMLLVTSPSPVTRYKEVFLKVAAMESGCTPIESTFVFQGSLNAVASVELDCSSKI